MLRGFALFLAWLLSLAGLYVALVILELNWNFYDWLPRYDLRSGLMILGSLAAMLAISFLLRLSQGRISSRLAPIACFALFALGAYVFPAEPLTQGLFARQAPSPFWYRAARLLVMTWPAAFWTIRTVCFPYRRMATP